MSGRFFVVAAKTLMRCFPRALSADDVSLGEIFRHSSYTAGTSSQREAIRLASAQFRYDYEAQCGFFEHFFPREDAREFRGKTLLDLGCFTGGRLVHWVKRHGFSKGYGIDVEPVYAEAGTGFATAHGCAAEFATGVGERLPYASDFFDYIICYEVFEHVQDVEKALREAMRTLKPGGKLFLVFPQYLQPMESHLGMATRLHGLQWIFSGKVLTQAAYEVVAARGPEHCWYNRSGPALKPWEKSWSLNGMSVRRFREIVRANAECNVLYWNKDPIFTTGRRAARRVFNLLSKLFIMPARLPVLEELFLGRICCVIQKKG